MLIVSYDFSSNKTRSKFSKFLEQYGDRVQLSVFKVKHSQRVLNNIKAEVEHRFKKLFKPTDSIYIFSTCEGCDKKILRYGSAAHEEKDVIYL